MKLPQCSASPARSTPGPLPYHIPNTPSTRLPGKGVELLRAVQHGRGQVLVHARLKPDVAFRQQLLAAP